MKTVLKDALTAIQLKMLSQRAVKGKLNALISQAATTIPNLKNAPVPYDLGEVSKHHSASRDDIVFVTSRFRSGSTFLWNIFRNTEGFTAYYEPFNERRWFDIQARGDNVDSTHRGVNDYWSEYNGMEALSEWYCEDWIRHHLLMESNDYNPAMLSYINHMVEQAGNRPLLQFNRIDFRLGWLKANYPNAKFLHLYRHPRDQWCSFLTNPQLMNKETITESYVDGFYLNVWCDDLSATFPFLDSEKTPHPYQRFYYLWKLSYLFGKFYSDLSFSFEELTRQPESTLAKIFEVLDVKNPPMDRLCGLIEAPEPDKWRQYADPDWFEALEQECEYTLDAFFRVIAVEEKF